MQTTATYARQTVTYDTASQLIAAGLNAAKRRGVPASIVVIDVAGEPIATARTDGASMLSMSVAAAKAWTAAAAGRSTQDVHRFVGTDPAAIISMPTIPRFTLVAGGFPIAFAGRPVGAIGVSGGSSDQDVEIAQEALHAVGEQ